MLQKYKSKSHSSTSYGSAHNFAGSLSNDRRNSEQKMASQMHVFLIIVEVFQWDGKHQAEILYIKVCSFQHPIFKGRMYSLVNCSPVFPTGTLSDEAKVDGNRVWLET